MTPSKQNLFFYLERAFNYDNRLIESLVSAFSTFNAKKREHLLLVGQKEDYVSFVGKGCIRTYFIKENGEEATRYVAFENTFINSLSSFLNRTPSQEAVQALEDTEGLRIHRDRLEHLLNANPLAQALYTKRVEMAFDHNNWRLETLMTMPAKARYQYFLDNQPEVIQRLSNKVLASYLGITQESLSRIKGRRP